MASKFSPKTPLKKGNGKNMLNQFGGQLLTTFLIFVVLVLIYSSIVERRAEVEIIAISELAQNIKAGQVEKIEIKNLECCLFYW